MSKNLSMRVSSASATISIKASRAVLAESAMSSGISSTEGLPWSPGVNTSAFMATRSTTPRNDCSLPSGSWSGTMVRPSTSRSAARERSRLARSRSKRLSTITLGIPSSSAAAQVFSVWTSTPATASTTTTAASLTRSAALASLRKFAIPGVSMMLILVLFHSAYARFADRVCFRSMASSSKSVTVVPSSTMPKRVTMPALNSMAEVSCVLPDPLCPTIATFLMLGVS